MHFVFRPFVFLLLCFSLHAQKKQSILTKKYPPQQLVQDVQLLQNVVMAMHPAVGIYETKNYLYQQFENYKTNLKDSLNEKQFRIQLKLLMDNLHCGHTEVGMSNKYFKAIKKEKQNFSPLVFLPLGDKVYYLASTQKKYDTLMKKGSQILSINGISCDSMLPQIQKLISGDGYNLSGKRHYTSLGFNNYYTSLYSRPDTFKVTFKKGEQIKSISYPAFKTKNFPPLPLGARDTLFTTYKRASMKFKYLDKNKKTFLLSLDKFSHRKINKAYRKIFRKLNENKTENLILDLRNNGGGSLANSYKLLTYLMDTTSQQTLQTAIKNYPYKKYTSGNIWFKFTRYVFKKIGDKKTIHDTDNFVYTIKAGRKNHFTGKVVVLINGGSFSASALVAAYLKYKNRAIFIGEETGGAIEGCNAGITPYYTLPNTKVKIRMPAFRIKHDVSPAITGHGIKPDYEIEYTIKDIFSKKDLELIKAKEILGVK